MIFFSFNNGFYGKKKNQEGLANNFKKKIKRDWLIIL
jgi:hypothetical protein